MIRYTKYILKYTLMGMIALLFLGLNSLQAAPGVGEWVRTNPGGGGAFAHVGAGPTGIIVAASDLSGAYRSADTGQTWTVIGLNDGLTTTHVGAVGFDPADPNILYLGTEDGIFRSADGGLTVTNALSHGYITDIEVAVSDPDIGYAPYHPVWNSNNGSIYKTTDRGLSWSQISNGTLPSGMRILKMQIHPTDEDIVYMLAGEGRFACGPAVLYESRDGGVNWTRLASAHGQITDFALDTHDPDILYLTNYGDVWNPGYSCVVDDAGGGFLFRGDYSGSSWAWTQLTSGSADSYNTIIWLDSDDQHSIRLISVDWPTLFELDINGDLVVIGDKNDWESGWGSGYGTSYNGDAKTIGQDLSNPDALLWIDSQFVYRSADDGRNFDNIYTNELSPGKWQSRGVDNLVTLDLAFNADSSMLYIAMPDVGCFRSDDYGTSWQNCNDAAYTGNWGEYGGNSMTIVADPTRPDVVWTTQSNEIDGFKHTLLRSSDGGANWTALTTGWPNLAIPSGLSVDPHSPQSSRTLFITAGGDVYRSTNDGDSWSKVFDCNGCHYTAIDPFDGNTVFAGGEAGLFRSTTGGSNGSWVNISHSEMDGSQGSIFWDKYWEGVSWIAPDPNNADRLYVSAFGDGKGLYRSLDGGDSWTKLLSDDYLRRVVVSPVDGDILMITGGSAQHSGGYEAGSPGVRRSTDGGSTFLPVNEGLDWPFANPIAFDHNNPDVVFVGSPGVGYAMRNFGVPTALDNSTFLPIVQQHHQALTAGVLVLALGTLALTALSRR